MTCCQAQNFAESGEISFYEGKDTTVPVYEYILYIKINQTIMLRRTGCTDQPKYPKPGISLLVTSWSFASHIHCKCLPVYETISWDEAWPIPIQLHCSLWHKTHDPWAIWPKVGIDQCSSFQHWLWEQKHGNFFLNILRDSDSTLHFEFDYHSISETPCFILYFCEVWTSQTVCTQITYCTIYSMMLSFHRIHLPSSITVKSSLFG